MISRRGFYFSVTKRQFSIHTKATLILAFVIVENSRELEN